MTQRSKPFEMAKAAVSAELRTDSKSISLKPRVMSRDLSKSSTDHEKNVKKCEGTAGLIKEGGRSCGRRITRLM